MSCDGGCERVEVLCHETVACRKCNAGQPVCRLCAFPEKLFDSKLLLAIVAVNRNAAEVAHCHNELALRYDYQSSRTLAMAHLRSAAGGGHEVARETLTLIATEDKPGGVEEDHPTQGRRHSI